MSNNILIYNNYYKSPQFNVIIVLIFVENIKSSSK